MTWRSSGANGCDVVRGQSDRVCDIPAIDDLHFSSLNRSAGIGELAAEIDENAHRLNKRFAIFLLGSSRLFANFEPHEIAAYSEHRGGQIHTRPIGGSDLIKGESIHHVALAISPAYTDQVSAKLRPLGVEIYIVRSGLTP